MYMYMHIYYTCIYIYMCVCVCIFVCMQNVCMYVCMYVCIYFDDLVHVKVDRPCRYLTWTAHEMSNYWQLVKWSTTLQFCEGIIWTQ